MCIRVDLEVKSLYKTNNFVPHIGGLSEKDPRRLLQIEAAAMQYFFC